MDSLNIKELKQKVKTQTEEFKKKSNHSDYLDETHQKLQYLEVDSVSGNEIFIESNTWNNRITYKKTIIRNNNPIIINIWYDENGKISGIGKTYSEEYLTKNARAIKYPTGKDYSYDESGDVTKIVDYDSFYKFTIDDVFKFLKKNYMSSLESIVEVGNAPGLSWEIWYRSTKYGHCEALIDAGTGKIIHDSKNIQSREN